MPANITTATLELNAIDNVTPTLQKVGRATSDLQKQYEALVATVEKIAGLGFAGLSVGALAGQIESLVSMQAEITRLSDRTGSSVEALSSLIEIAKVSHTEMDDVASAMGRLSEVDGRVRRRHDQRFEGVWRARRLDHRGGR